MWENLFTVPQVFSFPNTKDLYTLYPRYSFLLLKQPQQTLRRINGKKDATSE